MTTAHEELRERVARAMVAVDSGPEGCKLFEIHWGEFADGYRRTADAALRIALEAAAGVADQHSGGSYVTRDQIAAAIRALKGDKT